MRHPRRVVSPDTVSLTIELRRGSVPIDGSLIGPSGESSPFRGWIELTTALSRWVEGEQGTGPELGEADAVMEGEPQ